MSRNWVSYDKKVREKAKAEKKALFCIEINRQYCEHLPGNERGVVSMQGPANDAKAAEVSRLLLRFNGVREADIDALYPNSAALDVPKPEEIERLAKVLEGVMEFASAFHSFGEETTLRQGKALSNAREELARLRSLPSEPGSGVQRKAVENE